jgi:hypothetical protein
MAPICAADMHALITKVSNAVIASGSVGRRSVNSSRVLWKWIFMLVTRVAASVILTCGVRALQFSTTLVLYCAPKAGAKNLGRRSDPLETPVEKKPFPGSNATSFET